MARSTLLTQSAVALALALVGCKGHRDDAPAAATLAAATLATGPGPVSANTKLASIAMQTNVYDAPRANAAKIGYMRLGAVVDRSERSAGTDGCEGGWYAVAPRGFVCAGKTAALQTDLPILKAANVRPDTSRPLPYAYGFVRGQVPLYLRPPTRAETQRLEFKFDEHIAWFDRRGAIANRVDHLGANDVAQEIFPDAPAVPPPMSVGDGVLLGGKSEADPLPWWLPPGDRQIPNVSSFEVPKNGLFANRVKRHTGIAFIGTFQAGEWGYGRRFAITVDMRLVPIDRLKPEVGSTFHGVELDEQLTLPLAFARPCNPNAKGTPRPCVNEWRDTGKTVVRTDEVLPTREVLALTGKQRLGKNARFLETKDGPWVRASDVGIATFPSEWPAAARRGERWIDVSVEEQTLVLWEGKTPKFATLVSTGQDGLGDPKTTKSTPLGTFRVKSKHITATMDSNGRGSQSGGAAPTSGETSSPTDDDKHAGAFELRDVPYVQYFHEGYALHAAYWHDHFGMARSHGCINLAPIDALRVYRFTTPVVPEGWHGVHVEQGAGTVVYIHR